MNDDFQNLRIEIEKLRTERDDAARALYQISEAANIGHWEVDHVRSTVFWSKKTHELHGTEASVFVPTIASGIECFVPEHRSVIMGHFGSLTNSGVPFDVELEIVRRDSGLRRWVRVTGRPVVQADRVVKTYGTFQDIHLQKQREIEHEEIDTKLKLILDTFKIGFWDWNPVTDDLRWTSAMFPLFGIDPSEFNNSFSGWSKVVIPEDLERTRQELDSSMASSAHFNSSFRIRHSKLGVRHIRGSALIIRDSSGVPVRLWGINYDVTQEKSIEAHLAMLEGLVNASPAIFGIASPRGEMVFLNKAAHDRGWSEEKSLGEIFPVESIAKYINEIFPVLRKKGSWEGEVTFRDANTGADFPVMQQSFLLRGPDGKTQAVATIATDISEKKEMERQMEAQRLRLIHSSKMTSLGEMAGGIAHEINNPLAIIKGNVAVMGLQLDDGPIELENIRKGLRTIDTTVDRIASIIKALRGFARDMPNEPMERLCVAQLVENVVQFYQARLLSAGVKLKLDKLDRAVVIRGAQGQLGQALVNLLNNATDAVKGRPGAEIQVEVTEAGSVARICVIDSGPGVPAQHREKILEPFFTTKEVGKGTGLGLPMTKGIVEAHQGRLYLLEGAPRTTFVIEIPKL